MNEPPTSEPLLARVAELEARLGRLQAENERLAETQADAVLVGLLGEALQREQDPDALLAAGIERMGRLAGAALCAVCVADGDGLRVHRAWRAGGAPAEGLALAPSEAVRLGLAHGVVLDASRAGEAGLPRDGALAGFAPTAVVLLPFRTRALPEATMLVADDAAASRLPRAAPALARAADAVASRLENAALLAELRALNAALDEKVAHRTLALRATEERARLALEAVAGCAWQWDPAAGEVAWTGRAEALLGVDPAEAAPTLENWLARVHPEDRPAVQAALERARAGGAAPERVVHRLAGQDPPRWLELHARAAAAGVGPARVAGVLLDVTQRHRLEEELRQAQKMESVGRLAGGVAHDFNNLLTTILGMSELLLAGLAEGDPAREDVASIRDAGRRAALLTRQLLAFSRKQRLETRRLQLDEVIRAFAPMLSRLIGEDVAIRLDLAVDLPAVQADPSQVEQILMNLAVNSRDAMPSGGALTIGLDRAAAPAGEAGAAADAVRLTVADTGTGMPPEVAARAFEPFFTTKPRGKGTGLGLATVYGIVTQHGGTVEVQSAPGRGTTVEILLPAAAGAPRPADERAAAGPVGPGRGETVLVVDDEAAVLRAVARALQARGYAVVEASSGEEAVEAVRARGGAVDLLLTDVVMPGMRGPELVRAFRRSCPGRPALLMSGYPEAPGGEAELAGGYLEKPIDPDALARAVRAALDAARGEGGGGR